MSARGRNNVSALPERQPYGAETEENRLISWASAWHYRRTHVGTTHYR